MYTYQNGAKILMSHRESYTTASEKYNI